MDLFDIFTILSTFSAADFNIKLVNIFVVPKKNKNNKQSEMIRFSFVLNVVISFSFRLWFGERNNIIFKGKSMQIKFSTCNEDL